METIYALENAPAVTPMISVDVIARNREKILERHYPEQHQEINRLRVFRQSLAYLLELGERELATPDRAAA